MRAGLSQALTAWTGSISVTYGPYVATVTPVDGDSIASVMSRLVYRATSLISAATWQVTVSAAGVLTITASVAFDLATSSNTATRTALASGTGATSYTGSGAHDGGVYPSRGLSVRPGTPVTTRGRVSGDGSRVVAGTPAPGQIVLLAYGTFAELWSIELAAVGVHDVWADGARGVLARVWLTEARRVKLEKLSDLVQVALIGTEVSW